MMPLTVVWDISTIIIYVEIFEKFLPCGALAEHGYTASNYKFMSDVI